MPAAETNKNDNDFPKILFVEHVADEAEKRNEEPGVGKEASGIHLLELL
jgi:hypothetical protein